MVTHSDCKSVAVLGLWHLGLVTAGCLSDAGHKVVGFDANDELVSNLKRGKLPLFEPGLDELISKAMKAGLFSLSETSAEAVSSAEIIMITYDTPVDENDRVELQVIESTLTKSLDFFKRGALIIINSQVPVGSCERWQRMINERRPSDEIDVVCSPENIRLGQAIECFRHPDMVIIGSLTDRAKQKAAVFYEQIDSEKIFVTLKTAEMSKHALNVFFATSISFANELGGLCDAIGADGLEIAKILKRDSRIGKKAQVRPGLGFAGATLARDLRGLQDLGRKCSMPTPLIDIVLAINDRQLRYIVEMLELSLGGKLNGKKVCVLGLTYKPGTSTLRRSSSLAIIEMLVAKGATVNAHDPMADLSEMKGALKFSFSRNPYDALEACDGALTLTEWPEYRTLDFHKVKSLMKNPIILDAKNVLERPMLEGAGIKHLEIGRGQLAEVRRCCESV